MHNPLLVSGQDDEERSITSIVLDEVIKVGGHHRNVQPTNGIKQGYILKRDLLTKVEHKSVRPAP
jgi:hypothetical protein